MRSVERQRGGVVGARQEGREGGGGADRKREREKDREKVREGGHICV